MAAVGYFVQLQGRVGFTAYKALDSSFFQSSLKSSPLQLLQHMSLARAKAPTPHAAVSLHNLKSSHTKSMLLSSPSIMAPTPDIFRLNCRIEQLTVSVLHRCRSNHVAFSLDRRAKTLLTAGCYLSCSARFFEPRGASDCAAYLVPWSLAPLSWP